MQRNLKINISIHALLAESDDTLSILIIGFLGFLSTLSLRRATELGKLRYPSRPDFYPRSPCGERPHNTKNNYTDYYDFYPRSPCGERRTMTTTTCTASRFLSTLSLRRATRFQAADISVKRISIHALLAESDYLGAGKSCNVCRISIHALLAESDSTSL